MVRNLKAYNRQYYLRNRNKRLKYFKAYQEAHSNERKEYDGNRYQSNRAKLLAQARSYREKFPQRHLESAKRYRDANRIMVRRQQLARYHKIRKSK